ncbi:MAG TPA: carboxypeptidase-like regulatory domain-containing protein [Bryobacteraceae bacterium]|nr:carboxypeptidase-like regulatory domain-containing protein [Bryobacteraceae bacterium]
MSRYSIKRATLLSFVLAASAGWAQKTTGEIKGTVLDPGNAVVPKASVAAKDTATGHLFETLSGGDGAYLVPNLLPGKYSVTVTATGFGKLVVDGIVVETGRPTEVPLKLEVGTINQTVEVSSSAVALDTTTNQVATTVRNDYIKDLPLAGRDVFQFSSLSAGFTPGPSTEPGTFNGLFQGALNVTLDGTNVNDNRYKSTNGYASLVPLRLDAIEEVTVTTTGLQSDAAAGGAMTLQFMTRRGTSQYHGSVFEEVRNDFFNANDFFLNLQGLPKTKQKLNDAGGSLGGPLKIPGIPYLRNKLFFFLNYEDAPVPGATIKTATTLTPAAQNGNYTYLGTDGSLHTVNVLTLAGEAGYSSQIDPIVQKELTTINGTLSKGVVLPVSNNYFQQTINWKIPTGMRDLYPTARLDYQITNKWAYHVAWNLHHNHTDPTGPTYPGLPLASGQSKQTNYALSNGVDTTFSPTLFNSFKLGIQNTIIGLNIANSIHQWDSQGGRSISYGSGLNDVIPNAHPTIRGNPAYTYSDQLSWVKGKHTMKFGASGIYTRFYESDYYGNAGVLAYTLGIASSDPINSVFVAANFPFISTPTLSVPAQLYATLTGRVSSITGTQNIDEKTRQYEKFAPLVYRENYASWGTFFQDSFRVSPTLTLNYGLRWEFPGVMTNTNNTFMAPVVADLLAPSVAPFEPGVFGPAGPNYVPSIAQRSVTWATSRVNPAPNFGLAWNPRADGGFMAKLLGRNRTVIRSSYGIAYFDEGLNVDYWTNTNAGNWQLVTAAAGAQFAAGSLNLQSAYPPFVTAPQAFTPPFSEYQFAFNNYDVATTNPHMHEPYVQTWNFGIQRELSSTTLLEVRYVGNKTTHKWHQYTLQEANIFENGFLQEFQNAQRNLAINQANGKGSTFQNLGLPGDVPLPIFEHAFGPNGSFGALPSGSSWTSATFVNQLLQGQIGTTAATLQGRTASNEVYYCRLVGANFGPCRDLGYTSPSSYPINFWAPNPYVGQNDWMSDNSWGTYNGLQVTLRQRLSHGVTFTFNYTWSHALTDMPTQSTASGNVLNYTTIRDFNLDKGPLGNDRRQTYAVYGTYDLPFGPNRKWNFPNPVLSRVLGGWTIGAIANVLTGAEAFTGSSYRTINNYGDGGVLLQGLSASQFRGMLLESPRSLPKGVAAVTTADPSLIAAAGAANPAYLQPWQVAGTLGDRFYITGPWFWTLNTSLKKDVRIKERLLFTLQGEFLNVLNHPEFGMPNISPTSTTFGQVTTSQVGPRNIQLRGYFRW